MKKTSIAYVKKCWKRLLFYFGFLGLIYLVLYLYNIRQDALGYMVLLGSFFCVLAETAGFIRYRRHYGKLFQAVKGMPDEMGDFPKADDTIEETYQERMMELYEEKNRLESEMRIGRQEMQEYYGLWVHQIKTPISAMNLLLQTMEENDRAQRKEAVKELKVELFKTEQYVEMVLTYLRMEDISSDMLLYWYRTDTLVKQAVRKYSQMFILKKIKLNYTECSRMVLTDEKWMVFVLEQILSNALKYTKKGSISIYTEPEEGLESEDRCVQKSTQETEVQNIKEGGVLVIEDTGIGISAEDLPRVFEKGFTGYNGRQDKKSTGIGLYLCKSVCEKLNHTIRIYSVQGKGTKVKIGLSRRELHCEE
ncbi:sensor histidine kinase [Ruminococcus sp. AF18-22]|nr:sensor histidine kinase [Ruminococcus sp. AF18-22]